MRIRSLLITVATICVLSCEQKNEQILNVNDQNKAASEVTLSIEQLYNDTNSITFTDEGSFWLLYFEPGKVFFDFNPSCGYWFPSYLKNEKIIFNWATNMNCNFDRGLNQSFKGITSPKLGEPFGEILLENDTTLRINYYYKDWVKKVNEAEHLTIDTLFPSKFNIIHL